jgi:hypothetical protein
MRVQQFRDFASGKPAPIVKDVDAGLRIPGAVQHDIRHFRVEILTVQHIAFHGVNSRPVAGDQKGIEGKRAQQMAHLQHMAAGGKRQGDITLAQALQRVQGFLPKR